MIFSMTADAASLQESCVGAEFSVVCPQEMNEAPRRSDEKVFANRFILLLGFMIMKFWKTSFGNLQSIGFKITKII